MRMTTATTFRFEVAQTAWPVSALTADAVASLLGNGRVLGRSPVR